MWPFDKVTVHSDRCPECQRSGASYSSGPTHDLRITCRAGHVWYYDKENERRPEWFMEERHGGWDCKAGGCGQLAGASGSGIPTYVSPPYTYDGYYRLPKPTIPLYMMLCQCGGRLHRKKVDEFYPSYLPTEFDIRKRVTCENCGADWCKTEARILVEAPTNEVGRKVEDWIRTYAPGQDAVQLLYKALDIQKQARYAAEALTSSAGADGRIEHALEHLKKVAQ